MVSKAKRLRLTSGLVMLVSFIFYLWAVINTSHGKFDAGIVCFPVAFVAGLSGVYASLHRCL